MISLAPAQNDEIKAKGSLVRSLSKDGGKVVFQTKRFSNGKDPETHIGVDEATGGQVIEATGELRLLSDTLDLSCEYLRFANSEGILRAENDVSLEMDQINATAGLLLYTVETGGILLERNPFVEQRTEANILTFKDMDRFVVTPQNAGRDITITGSRSVEMQVKNLETDPANSEPSANSMQGLGNNILITSTAKPDQQALIKTMIPDNGEQGALEVLGSVVLKSDQFNIRADKIIFSPSSQLFTATGNVFLQEKTVNADCGKMVYNLETGEVVLTENPDVRSINEETGEVVRFTEYDQIIYNATDVGTPQINPVGEGTISFE